MDKLRTVPAVTGSGATQTYMSRGLTPVLTEAEKIASRMKDEFVSVEHLFLAAIDKDDDCGNIISSAGVSQAKVLEVLKVCARQPARDVPRTGSHVQRA